MSESPNATSAYRPPIRMPLSSTWARISKSTLAPRQRRLSLRSRRRRLFPARGRPLQLTRGVLRRPDDDHLAVLDLEGERTVGDREAGLVELHRSRRRLELALEQRLADLFAVDRAGFLDRLDHHE